jgi:hypothetical protein
MTAASVVGSVAAAGTVRGKAAADQLLRDLRRPVVVPDRLADALRDLGDDSVARLAFLREVQRVIRSASERGG